MIPTGSATRDSSTNVWDNQDGGLDIGLFWLFSQDDPSGSLPDGTFPAMGSESLDWGDIGRGTPDPLRTTIDCYVMGYATSVRGNRTAVAGLNAAIAFYNSDRGYNDSSFSEAAAIALMDIPGAEPNLPPWQGTAWILTVDLSGTTLVFDLDGDDEEGGGTSDFGYSYSFDQSSITGTQGLLGPILVVPAEAGPEGFGFATGFMGTAYGVENAFDWFKNGPAVGGPGHGQGSPTEYLGSFSGEFLPVPRTDPAFIPYLSFWMALFSPQISACPCDITGDATIDVGDFFAFVLAFASGDPAADVNGDGTIDVQDFFAFVACFADPPGSACA